MADAQEFSRPFFANFQDNIENLGLKIGGKWAEKNQQMPRGDLFSTSLSSQYFNFIPMKTIHWPAIAGIFAMTLLAGAPQGVAQDEPPPPPAAEGGEMMPPPPGGGDPADEPASAGSAQQSTAASAGSGNAAVSSATGAPVSTPAVSGSNAGAPRQPGGPRGGGGGDRMEQFRQRMNDFLKTSLKVTDEEWAVILPLLENVQNKQRESLGGRFGMFGGRRGGPGGPGAQGGPGTQGGERRPLGARPNSPEADALKTALDAEATAPAEIKAKLEALRESRKKATADLEQAREELRKVLTQRQEATLVLAGILD